MVLPIMTPEQRMDALAKATEARRARSVLLARVKSGELTPGQVFERTDDEVVKKTRVLRVLRALPGYGPAKATALMHASGVDEKRRMGGLTDAQRARLLDAVSPSREDDRTPDRSSDPDGSAPRSKTPVRPFRSRSAEPSSPSSTSCRTSWPRPCVNS